MSRTGLRAKDELELKIERTLEAMPAVVVPEDFAAKVAAQAKRIRRPLPEDAGLVRTAGVGRRVMWVMAALLLVAIVVLAPGAGRGSGAAHATRFWVAFALELEFAAVTVWLSLRGLWT